jgi:hypothetical protein
MGGSGRGRWRRDWPITQKHLAIPKSQSGRCLVEPRQPETSLDQTRRSFEYMLEVKNETLVGVASLISLEGVKVDLKVETRHL